jgi:hypothetical protein
MIVMVDYFDISQIMNLDMFYIGDDLLLDQRRRMKKLGDRHGCYNGK